MAGLSQIIKELRRRDVFRTGAAYLVIAWLLVQVSDILLSAFAAPEWAMRAIVLALAVGFPIVLVLAWIYEITSQGIKRTAEFSRGERFSPQAGRQIDFAIIGVLIVAVALFAADKFRWIDFGTETSLTIHSIAVLPLDNLSGDPEQEFFTTGMTEVLTSELAQIEALKVISRTSAMQYKGTSKLMPEIAHELNVDGLLEGSVLRIGDEVRITLQLVHGPSDQHIWAESFQRPLRDILTLQSEVARAIAGEIQIKLTPQSEARLARTRQVDPAAYELWLKGNFHLEGFDEASFQRARASFQTAIDRDPDYAPAYAGLAMSYIELGGWWSSKPPRDFFPLAKEMAEAALALDPDVAEAHLALGRILQLYEWDWAGAERAFQQGIALKPSSTLGLLNYANFLTSMGRFDDSIEISRQAQKLSPFDPGGYLEHSFALGLAGRDDEAFTVMLKAIEIDPGLGPLGFVEYYVKIGDFHKASANLPPVDFVKETMPPGGIGLVGHYYGRVGRHAEARALLAYLIERRSLVYVPAHPIANIYTGLEEHDKALQWFETAYEERNVESVWLKEHWRFDALRSDPRFQSILERMNFTEPEESPTRS